MVYLIKYVDKYDFGTRIFHYYDNDKDFKKAVNHFNDTISEEMKLGQEFTSYKIYRFSNKDAVIDTLLNSINHSGLVVETDLVADLIKD